MRTDIEFRLSGVVNGKAFEMNGHGVGDAQAGTCELHLQASPEFPRGFDPVSCPLICSHPTSTFFARRLPGTPEFPGIGAKAYDVSPAREGVLRSQSGEELLRLSVIGRTEFGAKLITTNVMRGTSNLPGLSHNVTPLKDYILPSGPGRATALVRYGLRTEAGETLDGVTTVPYVWTGGAELANPLVRWVESIEVAWQGGRAVSAYYKLSIGTLEETNRLAAVAAARAA
jgi:hypothetical protein